MKTQIHEQLILEMKLNERSNTIFVLASILLNLVILAVNSGLAGNEDSDKYILMLLFSLLLLTFSGISIAGIRRGRKIRGMLVDGLMHMYRDNGVEQYYNRELLDNYDDRYRLLIITILVTGAVSLIVPFLSAWLL